MGRTRSDSQTEAIINEEIENSKKLIESKQVLASSKIVFYGKNKILLEPVFSIDSSKIFALVKDCAEAYGFAVTIGPHIEKKRNLLVAAKQTSRALVLDAIGSVMAEELAEITNNQIKEIAKAKGVSTTKRFSPGYGDWKIEGQKDFLNWLGADKIGIRLTDAFQMLPEKSISAIIGLGKAVE